MSTIRKAAAAGWKRKEPIFWALLVSFVVIVQWPMLKGWYYRLSGSEATSSIAWRTSLDAALTEARETGRPVLADFTAAWCPPCAVMKNEVWPDAEVAGAVNRAFVPVMIDADQNQALLSRYDVAGVPTILVLNASGDIVRRNDGYLPRSGMLRFLAGQ